MLLNRWAFEVQKTNFTQLQVPVVLSLNLSMARRAVEEQLKPSSVFARLAPHTVTEARERPLEHQTSVFSAILLRHGRSRPWHRARANERVGGTALL